MIRNVLIVMHSLLVLLFVFALIDFSSELADDWLDITKTSFVLVSFMLLMSLGAILAEWKRLAWSRTYSWGVLALFAILIVLPALLFLGFDLLGMSE